MTMSQPHSTGILQFSSIPCDYLGVNKSYVCHHEGRVMQNPQKSQLSFTWIKKGTCKVKERVFSICLLSRCGMEQCRGWRFTLARQALVIPYCFTPEGVTSLNQTAEGSGYLGLTSNLAVWLHQVPARERLHIQLATVTFWRWGSPSRGFSLSLGGIRLTARLIQTSWKVLLVI